MENKYTKSSEVTEAEALQVFTYEEQISEIHRLINSLENKVSHISLELNEKAGTVNDIKPRLNQSLDEVIYRLSNVIHRIQN